MSTPTHPEQRPDEPQDLRAFLTALAVEDAPRCYAIAYDYDGNPDDSGIVAYGMAFPDHAETISRNGDYRVLTVEAEHAQRHFAEDDEVTMHLIWLPQPATST